MTDALLLKKYIEAFYIFDDRKVIVGRPKRGILAKMSFYLLSVFNTVENVPKDMWETDTVDNGTISWNVIECKSSENDLAVLEDKLNAKLPYLYRLLIMNYRFWKANLDTHRLLANPTGLGFNGLLQQIFADKSIYPNLLKNGFIQFAWLGELYDPVCFNLNEKIEDDCQIVSIDHETLMSEGKIEKKVLAQSYRNLVSDTIIAVEKFKKQENKNSV